MDDTLPAAQPPDRQIPEYQVIKGGSQKGQDMLVERGRFTYCVKERTCGRIYWTCSIRKCGAKRIEKDGQFRPGKHKDHNHAGKDHMTEKVKLKKDERNILFKRLEYISGAMAKHSENIPMGLDLRNSAFSLHPESAHITHGSWGTVPKRVFEKQMHYHKLMESEPDRFFRRYVWNLIPKNVEIISKFLGADPKNLVFVENTTTAINTAIKCLPLKKGDGILIYSWTYKSIENACRSAANRTGAEVVTLDLCVPINSQQEVIDKYRKYLEENKHIKVAVIEIISSPTATMFPYEELIEVCRSHDVITIIDGAHSPGQLPLDLETMGCDFYAGNIHKWMFSPRGCAVFWVSPRFQSITRPLVTSSPFNAEDWRHDFFYQGTRDYTPYLVVEDALEFYNSLGGMKVIQAYTDDLLEKAVSYMAEQFGTSRFPIPKDMEAPYMRVVELPQCEKYVPTDITGVFADMSPLMDDLWDQFKVEVTALYIHGRPYIRLSCYVYSHFDDFVKVTQAIKNLYSQA